MTIWNVDIMWAMMLFGITLFLGCFIVTNRAMRGMRIVGVVTSYAIGAWMFIALPWRVALTTWCLIAFVCGFVVFACELWARHRYAGTARTPRPLVLLQGVVFFPAMLPDAMEAMIVDAGILPPTAPRGDAP